LLQHLRAAFLAESPSRHNPRAAAGAELGSLCKLNSLSALGRDGNWHRHRLSRWYSLRWQCILPVIRQGRRHAGNDGISGTGGNGSISRNSDIAGNDGISGITRSSSIAGILSVLRVAQLKLTLRDALIDVILRRLSTIDRLEILFPTVLIHN
jgi:hypothetical protein